MKISAVFISVGLSLVVGCADDPPPEAKGGTSSAFSDSFDDVGQAQDRYILVEDEEGQYIQEVKTETELANEARWAAEEHDRWYRSNVCQTCPENPRAMYPNANDDPDYDDDLDD